MRQTRANFEIEVSFVISEVNGRDLCENEKKKKEKKLIENEVIILICLRVGERVYLPFFFSTINLSRDDFLYIFL